MFCGLMEMHFKSMLSMSSCMESKCSTVRHEIRKFLVMTIADNKMVTGHIASLFDSVSILLASQVETFSRMIPVQAN